jgi:hypothetical protein
MRYHIKYYRTLLMLLLHITLSRILHVHHVRDACIANAYISQQAAGIVGEIKQVHIKRSICMKS